MGVFEMVFGLVMAGMVLDTLVKLVRGHPAKDKEIKALRARVEELDHKLGDTMTELAETRTQLDDEMTMRAELEERLDFTERMLARGPELRQPDAPHRDSDRSP